MKTDWNFLAADILKVELKRKRITYKQLQQSLLTLGVHETTNGIKVKLNRGAFQFSFFLQCAAAIELKKLYLGDINIHESKVI